MRLEPVQVNQRRQKKAKKTTQANKNEKFPSEPNLDKVCLHTAEISYGTYHNKWNKLMKDFPVVVNQRKSKNP